MTAALLGLFALIAICGWIAKRNLRKLDEDVRSIEALAYARGSAEWQAYFDVLYALNPCLREAVEANRDKP